MSFTEYNFDIVPNLANYPDYALSLPVKITKQTKPPTHWLTRTDAKSEKVPTLDVTYRGPFSLVSAPQD